MRKHEVYEDFEAAKASFVVWDTIYDNGSYSKAEEPEHAVYAIPARSAKAALAAAAKAMAQHGNGGHLLLRTDSSKLSARRRELQEEARGPAAS